MQFNAIFPSGSCPGRYRTYFQAMKLTALILLVACMQLSARTVGQNVTLSLKNAPMKEVFREIHRQSGIDIIVNESVLDKTGKVTLAVKDMPVSDVLNLCFR